MYSITPPYFTAEGALHILVFKTNIRYKKDFVKIENTLKAEPSILYWNIDKDDKDYVLRIESKARNVSQIIAVIRKAGYMCEELID